MKKEGKMKKERNEQPKNQRKKEIEKMTYIMRLIQKKNKRGREWID